jgi:hypothetical protein
MSGGKAQVWQGEKRRRGRLPSGGCGAIQRRGYGARHLVSLAIELIGMACDAIRSRHESADPAEAAVEPAIAAGPAQRVTLRRR